ncbi:DUF302 domain-containing protein [Bordetella genomosp. 1]|nr:DUF302 domain-containing protein [Bordetella genomosp. 1]
MPLPKLLIRSVRHGAVAAMLLVSAAAFAAPQGAHTMKLASAHSFSDTLQRLRAAFAAKGLKVFATIDHQAAAQADGLAMPPTTVLIYGSPKAGTPLMLAAPDFALALPLRVLVREDEAGRTWVVYDTSAAYEGKHGLPAGMAERLAPAETLLAAAIAP